MKKLILVSGKMRSGKNTFAEMVGDIMANEYNIPVHFDMFAKDLKDGVWSDFYSLHTFIYQQYWKLPKEVRSQFEWMNVKRDDFYENKSEYGRMLLQIYGTQIFRNRVDADYWVNQVYERWQRFFTSSDQDGVYIITDVRFPNEIQFFNDRMVPCVSVRVNRDTKEGVYNEEHHSEKALDNFSNFDRVVCNCGTLSDLKDKAYVFCQGLIGG